MNEAWYLDERAGLTLVRCRPLDRVPGVAHAFSTRRGGEERSFDLGPADTEDETLLLRRRRLQTAAGLAGELFLLHQVHGRELVQAGTAEPACRADGVWLDTGRCADWSPTVRTADCVPLLLAERDGGTVAAVHAGWRGTAAGIAERAVATLKARGVRPDRLVAALGPAILACCYEVGPEAMEAVASSAGAGVGLPAEGRPRHFRLDLHAANRIQLERAGVGEVHAAPWCTCCRPELFFSYRGEGERAGRQAACIGAAR